MKDDEKDKIMETNIINLDDARVKRLSKRGHMSSMLEEFEILRLKVIYDQSMSPAEVIKFITLCKYFSKFGPSEAFRLSCSYMLNKYIDPFGL